LKHIKQHVSPLSSASFTCSNCAQLFAGAQTGDNPYPIAKHDYLQPQLSRYL